MNNRAFSPRRFFPVRTFIFAVLSILTIHPLSADEWLLTYTLNRESPLQASRDPLPIKANRSDTLIISLGQQHLGVDDGHNKRVYDFARRRIVYLNLDQHEYSSWSLYSGIAARVRELENRFNLGASLPVEKTSGKNFFGRYDNEANLGLEIPGMKSNEPDPVITRTDLSESGWEFWHDNLSVVQFAPAKEILPAVFYPRFANFLAYECSIHPKIRRQIVATGKIPQLLAVRWQLGGESKAAIYRLQSIEHGASDSTTLPVGFQPAPAKGNPAESLLHLISLVREDGRTAHRSTREQVERFAKDAISQHRALDAYFALLEYRLQSGERHPNDFRQYQRDFDQDDRCRLYITSQDQSSSEACRKGLAACESIDRTGLQKAYMLDLQRADLLQILGRGKGPNQQNQTVAAEKLFLSVLETNPFLAGAYHDLGRLYDETFRSSEAWLCFDTARQISPDHFMLKGITNLELRFEHDFPDYF
jgi:hypothetical protein